MARPDGSLGSFRGAPSIGRLSCFSHERWNGEKTVYGFPDCVRGSTDVVNHAEARMAVEREPGALQRAAQALVAPARERRHVGSEMELVRPDLRGERRQLALGRATAHYKATAAIAQRTVEVAQALEQELRPGPDLWRP